MVDINTIEQIAEQYANLLIIQYRNKPKARAFIKLLYKLIIADGVVLDVLNAFDLDTAVGNQLDVLGKYIGVDRYYLGINLSQNRYFAFGHNLVPVDELYAGFGHGLEEGRMLKSSDITAFALSDDDYRKILRFKIILNTNNGNEKHIDDAIYKFFGLDVIPQYGDMSISYLIKKPMQSLVNVCIQKHLLPKPIAIRINCILRNNEAPFFAFGRGLVPVNEFYAGFGHGLEEGSLLNQNDVLYPQ